MLIPATISLFVSAIILNFGLAFNGAFFNSASAESPKAGLVLGVSEHQTAGQIIVLEGGNFSQAIVKVIQEAKTSPLGQFFQFSQPARQLPENQVKEPAPQTVYFDLAAETGAILDGQNDNLFFSKKSDQPRPIASITKLFTAFTFLDYNPGWETSYEIKAADKREGGKIYLFTGDKVTVKADPKRQVWEVYWFEPLSEIYYLKRWDEGKNDFQVIHVDALTADRELNNLE